MKNYKTYTTEELANIIKGKIDLEKIFIENVKEELPDLKAKGEYYIKMLELMLNQLELNEEIAKTTQMILDNYAKKYVGK